MKPRKKKNKSSHLRRQFIGARMEFDGNEENGQICELASGRQLNELQIDLLIKFEFRWMIAIKFIYKNDLGFVRTVHEEFKVPTPCRFNSLKGYADELGIKAGLDQPDGYTFDSNTWKARIIG